MGLLCNPWSVKIWWGKSVLLSDVVRFIGIDALATSVEESEKKTQLASVIMFLSDLVVHGYLISCIYVV